MKLNNVDKVYHDLLNDILENGHIKGDRTGTGTISLFGKQIRFNMKDRFPLITTKKLHIKSIIRELLWFLSGDTNTQYLNKHGVTIWDEWAYSKYVESANKCELASRWLKYDDQLIPKNLDDDCRRALTIEEFRERIINDDEFADKFGYLGPIYGHQWVNWTGVHYYKLNLKHPFTGEDTYQEGTKSFNQIEILINRLKTNPDCRRMIVSAWNVADLEDMSLAPCHYGFQVWTRELTQEERWDIAGLTPNMSEFDWCNKLCEEQNIPKREISLSWNQRSCDMPLGIPFNIASYAFLLHMIAQQVDMVPGELIGNLGDCHIYLNQVEQIKEQLNRESKECKPALILNKSKDIFLYQFEDFKIENYESHPSIKMPISI